MAVSDKVKTPSMVQVEAAGTSDSSKDKKDLSRGSTAVSSPKEGADSATGNDNTSGNSKVDSNLIVRTSENGKIEDIISPVALQQNKPFQDETMKPNGATDATSSSSKESNNVTSPGSKESNPTVAIDSNHMIKDQQDQPQSAKMTPTTSNDPIANRLNQTSLKRRRIPPPLGITPNKQQKKTDDKNRKVSKSQTLKRPRAQYLGKVNPQVMASRQYPQTATTPYSYNRSRMNQPSYGNLTPYPQQGPGFQPPMSASMAQQQGIPPFGLGLSNGPFPHSGSPMAHHMGPFPTSAAAAAAVASPSYMPPYYYPYGRFPGMIQMPPPPPSSLQAAAAAAAAYYPYNGMNQPPYPMMNNGPNGYMYEQEPHYSSEPQNETLMDERGETAKKVNDDNEQVEQEDETSEETDSSRDSKPQDETGKDDDDIEGSDLAIEEGAVPTPIFTRFPQGISSEDQNGSDISQITATNTLNNRSGNNVMFGEIRIQDNRFSFEFPQRDDSDLNKKIFMSICNQIWNEARDHHNI